MWVGAWHCMYVMCNGQWAGMCIDEIQNSLQDELWITALVHVSPDKPPLHIHSNPNTYYNMYTIKLNKVLVCS